MKTTEVRSVDGTMLSARVTGSGPPLVLVHGTTGSKDSWAMVEPGLGRHHATWSYDRRGRGGSGDVPGSYSLDREVDDLLAVLSAAGPNAHLVGHSFGGCVALEAARCADDLASLVLYEPPFHVSVCADAIDRATAMIEEGDLEGGLRLQLLEVAGLSPDELALVSSIPEVWTRFLATAETIPREVSALAALPWDPTRYGGIETATLLLTGELTGTDVYLTADELRQAIPTAEHAVMPGQRHIAFATDPDVFVASVARFTAERESF